jgi:hypothetical protein
MVTRKSVNCKIPPNLNCIINQLLILQKRPARYQASYQKCGFSVVFYRSANGTGGIKKKGHFYPVAGVRKDCTILKHNDSLEFLVSLESILGFKYSGTKFYEFNNYLRETFESPYDFSLNQELYSLGNYLKRKFRYYAKKSATEMIDSNIHSTKVVAINESEINDHIHTFFLDKAHNGCGCAIL